MITTRRTGAWWFMRTLCEYYRVDLPDSDGEFFFFPGRLVSQKGMLSALRDAYAFVKLKVRTERYLAEIGQLNRTYFHCSGPPTAAWYFCSVGICRRRSLLRRNVLSLNRRLDDLLKRNIFEAFYMKQVIE